MLILSLSITNSGGDSAKKAPMPNTSKKKKKEGKSKKKADNLASTMPQLGKVQCFILLWCEV